MRSELYILFVICCLALNSLSSQGSDTVNTIASNKWEIGVSFALVDPIFAFDRKMAKNGVGISGAVFRKMGREKPLYLGNRISWFLFSRLTTNYEDVVDGEIFEFRDRTGSNLLETQFLCRFQPELNFWLWPYVESGVGLQYFHTSFSSLDLEDDSVFGYRIDHGDIGLMFSLNGGAQFNVLRGFLLGDLGIGYTMGSFSSYDSPIEASLIDPDANPFGQI